MTNNWFNIILDNLIKSWLPHVKVLEPTRFKDKIKKELQSYLMESTIKKPI